MFSKFKSSTASAPPQNPYDNNPITQYFEIGKQVACAGPELIWKIHEGYRKTDGKPAACFRTKSNANSAHETISIQVVLGMVRENINRNTLTNNPSSPSGPKGVLVSTGAKAEKLNARSKSL
uniref:Uncharacterized protein n=1 Tax=Anopheles atroparvus TaxID=41427 RepID=A0A182JJX5_ANOAO